MLLFVYPLPQQLGKARKTLNNFTKSHYNKILTQVPFLVLHLNQSILNLPPPLI